LAGTEQETMLRVSRRFAAPREKVFDAWTNPDVLRRWWAGSETMETAGAEVDAREGGRYRLSMRDTESDAVHTVVGEYTEVRRPERLVFTWSWEGDPGPPLANEETRVEVEFVEDGDGTEVVLTHTGFGSPESRGMHEHGWGAVLASLERNVFPG
jgi:uncharacterized protein YndB with AHSA1/START domain